MNAESTKRLTALPWMVFDVESIGLHGEGYAVGYVTLAPDGLETDFGIAWTAPSHAHGCADGHDWVRKNADPERWGLPPTAQLLSTFALREWFWTRYRKLQSEGLGCRLAADCNWPVEARFLARCIDDAPETRRWAGPYPLVDIGSVRLAARLDPTETTYRLPNERPEHNPLADARQSARLLLEALRTTGALR